MKKHCQTRQENIFSKRKWLFLFFSSLFPCCCCCEVDSSAPPLCCVLHSAVQRERRRTHALLLRRRRCCRGRCRGCRGRGWPSGERRDLAPFPRLRRRTFPHPLLARRSQERRRVRHLGFKASLWVVTKENTSLTLVRNVVFFLSFDRGHT